MSVTASSTLWYAARAGGIVTYLALTATALAGLLLAGRPRLRRWPRFALEDVHRFLGLLVWVFGGLHVLSIAVDTYLPFTLESFVVPFTAPYRPFWTGLGVISFELLLAVGITNRLRRRLPHRVWRAVHVVNVPTWALATLHAAVAGTDRGEPWFVAFLLGSTTAVGAALVSRLRRRPPRPARRAAPSPRPGAFLDVS